MKMVRNILLFVTLMIPSIALPMQDLGNEGVSKSVHVQEAEPKACTQTNYSVDQLKAQINAVLNHKAISEQTRNHVVSRLKKIATLHDDVKIGRASCRERV